MWNSCPCLSTLVVPKEVAINLLIIFYIHCSMYNHCTAQIPVIFFSSDKKTASKVAMPFQGSGRFFSCSILVISKVSFLYQSSWLLSRFRTEIFIDESQYCRGLCFTSSLYVVFSIAAPWYTFIRAVELCKSTVSIGRVAAMNIRDRSTSAISILLLGLPISGHFDIGRFECWVMTLLGNADAGHSYMGIFLYRVIPILGHSNIGFFRYPA